MKMTSYYRYCFVFSNIDQNIALFFLILIRITIGSNPGSFDSLNWGPKFGLEVRVKEEWQLWVINELKEY